MFKNVAQAFKMTNQVNGDEHMLKKAKGPNSDAKQQLSQNQSDTEPLKMANDDNCDNSAITTKNGGFLVRRGKKKLSKIVARLQRVRSLSAHMKQQEQQQIDHKYYYNNNNYANSQATKQAMLNKDKVVTFKLNSDKELPVGDCARTNDKSAMLVVPDNDNESDDDDYAYVSASETFDDTDTELDDNNNHKQAQEPDIFSQRQSGTDEDEQAGDKVVLPEELCDIPTFLNTKNSPSDIIEETRRLLRERYAKNPDSFYETDYKRMLNDDWTVTRFLLRRRQDPRRTAKLMEECGKFRRTYKMGEVQLWEFPIEFHLAGGLFKYAPDLVGNVTMYMRVKMYRRVPEISDVFKAFILCTLEQCDRESNGRGTAVVFDLTGCSLQNVDLGFLYWLLNSFRNYCPKGVSYIIVYNLPWFLSATAKMAMSWLSETNRRSLRFVHGKEIENFIAKQNLPDYLGGTCPLDYRAVPAGSRPAVEVCQRIDISVEQAHKIKELFKEYLPDDYHMSAIAHQTESPPTEAVRAAAASQECCCNVESIESQEVTPAANISSPSTGNEDAHQQRPTTQTATIGRDDSNQSADVRELVSQASKFMVTN